jgi:xanthine dehydrogenase YagS FAD-binding subunit
MGIEKCAAVCPSDTAVALAALDACIRIMGPGGERTVPVQDFFTPLGNVLHSDEIVSEVQVPQPSSSSKQAFIKLSLRRPVDFALVSAATMVSFQDGICTGARICLGAVAPTPVRAMAGEQMLVGAPLTKERIHAAATAAMAKATPLGKNAYKVELAKAVVRKALVDKGMSL